MHDGYLALQKRLYPRQQVTAQPPCSADKIAGIRLWLGVRRTAGTRDGIVRKSPWVEAVCLQSRSGCVALYSLPPPAMLLDAQQQHLQHRAL